MRYFYFLIFLILVFASSGCSIGHNQTYCERNGADYSEAGVCRSMMWIIQNSKEATEEAYRGDGRCGRQ